MFHAYHKVHNLVWFFKIIFLGFLEKSPQGGKKNDN